MDASISPADTQAAMDNPDVLLLDVRTPAEYAGPSGHLPGALLIPIQELQQRLIELEPARGKTVIVYCRTAHRSAIATKFLNASGFRALNMTGGIVQWTAERRPVTRDH